MITADELDDLPSDPDEAICFLAETLREKVLSYNRGYEDGDQAPGWEIERNYINYLRGFIIEYNINIDPFLTEEPPITDDNFNSYYAKYNILLDQYVAHTHIRMAMKRKRERIPLDAKTKTKIHHYINQIREILQKLDIALEKREEILDRLNKFADAVDKERTDVRRVLDVILMVADTGSEAAKKLSPVRKLLDSITGLLAEAREWTDRQLGTTWKKPKELEAPRKRLPSPEEEPKASAYNDLDDEIPF